AECMAKHRAGPVGLLIFNPAGSDPMAPGQFILSFLIGDYKGFNFYTVSPQSAWAFAYLVIFGSILGFSCFNYLINRISADKVSTSTYINPIVAMVLGWAVLGEVITKQSIIAALVMLLGVFFINIDLLTVIKKRKIRASRI
ncbi:MAG: EamA family transporter, partial [Saprospiraceae bacterium]|nr:EamA family transporter [Saprospiraceae bacterium]